MENSKEALRREIEGIKNRGITNGTIINEEEMAGKLDISVQQLNAYLNGEDPIPDDLPSRLRAAYTIRQYVVRSSTRHRFRRLENDGLTSSERDRESLRSTMKFIKRIGEEKGRIITDEELALNAGITIEQLSAYLSGEANVPADLASVLFSAYSELIDHHRMETNLKNFRHTVLLIRNLGLSVGRDITVKDMAGQIGIAEEELYAYLNDETEMLQDDLANNLHTVYNDLLEDMRSVEIIEDIHVIKSRNK